MPFTFLVAWLAGMLPLALLGAAAYLVWAWYVGEVVETVWLIVGIVLLLWSVFGRSLVLLTRRGGTEEPRSERGGRGQRVAGPGGADLHVEEHGPEVGAPTLLMTHGWVLDATAWYYEKKHLADRFRLVLWDLPGLGLSTQPKDGRYSLEGMAHDLRAVFDATAGGRRVVLVGHSIGGMTILTFCRLFPELLGREIAGIVLVNTTYTMPLNTIIAGGLLRALRWSVLVPLLYLTTALWPLVWPINRKSYLDGSAHKATSWATLSGQETRGQLDFAARFTAKQHPGVLAKGILAMLRWDETATLPTILVPTLIITSDRDKLTLPRASEEMARLIPRAELLMVEPAGHLGFLERSVEYDEAIAGFAARCLARATPAAERLRGADGTL
ncbi:alpha/beta fold hydrolase [Dankookia sp. GCM10030260]|uniref:alpha/beta fold hydrolase n=1 Tax=Dankookia sp. GCM10030260 TaxID=3273390 RepID=UPI0036157C16